MEATVYPRSILHSEYICSGRRVILDACELRPGRYETMLLRLSGKEIASRTAADEQTARADYNHLRHTYAPDTAAAALTGKYAKLRDDLRTAAAAARDAAGSSEDGGTCNFDSAALVLPRWREALVKQAATEAGCTCSRWSLFGQARFVFYPIGIAGQANRRTRAAEAMTRKLQALGYSAFDYCQAD